MVRTISNTNGVPTTLIPLSFVVVVDACFQILEDLARHKADAEANASLTSKFSRKHKKFVNVRWRDLAVGDIIQIHSRENVPADVLILGVAEKPGASSQGSCYVETKSLDGETNLKLRSAIPSTYPHMGTTSESMIKFVSTLNGEIEMEHPNKLIETFSGICDFAVYKRESIQSKNILLRGCVLRNTDHVVGVVVNTGHDTKIMMSSTGTPSKTSILESKATREIQRIIYFLVCICCIGATGQAIWNNELSVAVQEQWYLKWDPDEVNTWINQFFYFFLLHATFIPVSLYVSMSAARYFQSKFMNLDLDMYHEKTDTPALVRTMTLNEELGQISHIFSDKTGTLTCNVMDFRKASIGGISYGEGITEIGKVAWRLQGKEIPEKILRFDELAKQNSVPHVTFYCPKYEQAAKTEGPTKRRNDFFMKTLAICHDIVPERTDNGIILSASNPDDEANVAAAKFFGIEFLDCEEKTMVIKNHETGALEKYEILEIIGFSSKRKRMSIAVRDVKSDEIILMTKGADSVIIDRLLHTKKNHNKGNLDGGMNYSDHSNDSNHGNVGSSSSSSSSSSSNGIRSKGTKFATHYADFQDQDSILRHTMEHMNQYAVEGLRCLLVSYKILDAEEFNCWHAQYRTASSNLVQIDLMKKGLDNEIDYLENELESGLMLMGCTAIEDKLQDGVPHCISMLVSAGINIWMLTGDKEETAMNIAIACNLLQPKEYMKHVIVNDFTCPTESSVIQLLDHEIRSYDRDSQAGKKQPRALIIDGPSLVNVLLNKRSKLSLLEFGKRCKAVVGCRVSPDQKKEMVTLIKNGIEGVRTLAVGDGANDVAMIQAAHVGIGMKGEEGLQAVNSADFAIAQFRFLAPLLLKHGRSNYIRLSSLVIYMFYKNIFMSLCQFWFAFFNGFSGQKIYTEGAIQLFNILFTSWPILILAAFDMDLSFGTVSRFPQIYQDCINNAYFRSWRLWFWLIQAGIESVICTLLSLWLTNTYSDTFGNSSTFWEAGALCFTAVIVICSFKILLLQHRVSNLNLIVLSLSVLSWVIIATIINVTVKIDYNWNHVWYFVCSTQGFWFSMLVITASIATKDVLFATVDRLYRTRNCHILQEAEVYQRNCKNPR